MKKFTVWFLAIFLGLLTLIYLFTPSDAPKKRPKIKQPDVPKYKIIRVDDVSIPWVKRISIQVYVQQKVKQQDLVYLGKYIAKKYRRKSEYKAIRISFNDREEFSNLGNSLGVWIDAPEGKWDAAWTAKPPNYSNFKDNSRGLKAKDWSERPDKEQVKVWSNWQEIYRSENRRTRNIQKAVKKATVNTAKKFNINEYRVETIIFEVEGWLS